MLTASPKPVLVEPFDQQDEDEGLPEKSVNKNSNEYKEQRDIGPRFADQGTFEHSFALRWKELYEIEKQKRDRLEQEIQEARTNLENQFEYSRIEHKTMSLKSQLEQLENNKLRLQHMKEQTINDAQHRDEHRRQQDMLIRQREEDILRRQLGNSDGLNQQETLRMQATALQDLLNNQDYSKGESNDTNQPQQSGQASNSQIGPETESSLPNTLLASPLPPTPARSFADAAMMAINNQQQYIPVQQQMGLHPSHQNLPMNAPNVFTAYMPQHQMQMSMDVNQNYAGYAMPRSQQTTSAESGRQQKFNRPYNNAGSNSSNNINLSHGGGGRQRKRGRF